MYDLIVGWYKAGIWKSTHVQAAVAKGWITQAQAEEILTAAQA